MINMLHILGSKPQRPEKPEEEVLHKPLSGTMRFKDTVGSLPLLETGGI